MIITSRKQILPPDSKFIFAPIGDIHFNAPGHDREKFKDIIQWIAYTSTKPDRIISVPLMGDELETLSGSERYSYRASALHSSSRARIEQMITEDLENFLETIKPIWHVVDTVVSGNHNFRFQESISGHMVGKTTSQIIAERLNKPYLGICGVNIIEFSPGNSTSTYPFKVLMHHGFGVANTKGNSINQMIKLKEKFPMCNLYIMGHNHVKIGTTTEGIDFRKNTRRGGQWEMCDVVQGFVRSASFLKGYIPGELVDVDTGSYVEEKCLVPAGLGIVTANLRWKKDKKGRCSGFNLHTQE